MMSTADHQLGLLHRIQISNLSTSIMEDFEVEGYYDSNNTSDYVFDISVSIFNATSRILVPTTFFLLALMGLVGNCSVMFIICRHTDMQTVTNYFIANLAITDVATVLFCILPTALQSSGIIPMSTGVCKGVNYIQFVSKTSLDNSHNITQDKHDLKVISNENTTLFKIITRIKQTRQNLML